MTLNQNRNIEKMPRSLQLATLLQRWQGCKARRPSWRAFFQLASAPRPGRDNACSKASRQRGLSTQVHLVAHLNAIATAMVEAAGFEVLDLFPATLHAPMGWFDPSSSSPLGWDDAEALSDLATQLLISRLCASSGKVSEELNSDAELRARRRAEAREVARRMAPL